MSELLKHRLIVGENIRLQRKRLGMTQETLAEKADLHPVYVGNVERGEENISLDSLMRIAKALEVKVKNLIENV